jgi:uncharacterized protein (TIGR03085 family)
VSRELAQRQLARCCDALAAAGPDARTLCVGWSAWDLAAHLWVLKHDPLAWPGMVVPRLAPQTDRRLRRVRARWPFTELVERLRAEASPIACMPLDRFENWRHCLGEYFVHTQDVARAVSLAQPLPDPALEQALWLRLAVAAPQLHRRRTPGLLLVRPDGDRIAVSREAASIEVSGPPSELMCWVYGRTGVAAVSKRRVSGSP